MSIQPIYQFLSHKIRSLAESSTIAMNQKAANLREKGHNVIDLSLGEPHFLVPRHILNAATDAVHDPKYHRYPPVAGYKDLREAIAKKLQLENKIPCTIDNIVVSTGAKQSLTNIFECIIDPGDEVVVYTPYWVSYKSTLDLCGAVLVPLAGKAEDNFVPKAETLANAITPKTKAILFSNPNNPTGAVIDNESLLAMSRVIGANKNVLAISDEIYEYIRFCPEYLSIGSLPEIKDRVVTINGISKAYCMTGWRIGYMAAHDILAKACTKLQGQTTSGSCGIAQRAAIAAMTGDQTQVRVMRETYLRQCDYICDAFRRFTLLKFVKPMGAFYLFCSIEEYIGCQSSDTLYIQTAADLCGYILEEAKVAVVPGDGFGVPNYIRLSYAVGHDVLVDACNRIATALGKIRCKPT